MKHIDRLRELQKSVGFFQLKPQNWAGVESVFTDIPPELLKVWKAYHEAKDALNIELAKLDINPVE